MKELSIEEKAKRYDEVINRMKHYVIDEYGCSRIKVTDVFPELKKSEDERIRKALVEMVHDTTGDSLWIDYNVHKEDAIAWLEKQSQAPAWREQDEEKIKEIKIAIYNQYNEDKAEDLYYYFLEPILYKVQPQPKQGWNKEDEYNYEIVMYCLNNQCVGAKDKENAMSWFKSFKDRVGCEVNCTTTKEWKPSERQISALEWQLKNTSEGSWQYIETEKLLERLKNL